SAAPDATADAELFVPGVELVSQPVSIAGADAAAHRAGGGVAELMGEAGLPFARAGGAAGGQVVAVGDGGAEAGGADHGAVAATETALGERIPMRTVDGAIEQ